MNFHILTLFPEMVLNGLNTSIIGRAVNSGLLSIEAVNIRDYAFNKHQSVDDYPYGGGAGMLMQAEPVYLAWEAVEEKIKARRELPTENEAALAEQAKIPEQSKAAENEGKRTRVVYLSPQGNVFNQKMAEELAQEEDLILLCGHYEGIDERVLEEIVTDDREIYTQICGEHTREKDGKVPVRFYEDKLLPLSKLYRLEKSLEEALDRKVWLRSGGFLVIEQTEAFVSIDVNSGKFSDKKNTRETFRKINLEAAREIAFQLRLRNLSGIILIDFINMEEEEDKKELLKILQGYLRKDPIKAAVVDMTPLNIVEVTRKKVEKSLEEEIKKRKDWKR